MWLTAACGLVLLSGSSPEAMLPGAARLGLAGASCGWLRPLASLAIVSANAPLFFPSLVWSTDPCMASQRGYYLVALPPEATGDVRAQVSHGDCGPSPAAAVACRCRQLAGSSARSGV